MFKVTFANSKLVTPFDVANVKTLEEAVQLALALHRASNCPHVVCVYHKFESKISFELFDKDDFDHAKPVNFEPIGNSKAD